MRMKTNATTLACMISGIILAVTALLTNLLQLDLPDTVVRVFGILDLISIFVMVFATVKILRDSKK